MDLVFHDGKKRKITERENILFSLEISGLYLIEIAAKAQGEKQLQSTDDGDLRIEIDDRKFPQLNNHERYADSPAAFSGGKLKGLKETIFLILPLNGGKHVLSLIPDQEANLENIRIFNISETSILKMEINDQAEDGDRRPWVTFVLVDVDLTNFSVALNLKKRFIDSDDVKVIINGEVKRNYRNFFHKLWYFIASINTTENQTEVFNVNFSPGLHYLELWADRMPNLKEFTLVGLISQSKQGNVEDKIRRVAKEYGLDSELMVKVARKESGFNPLATSPVGAKGIFQLMGITIKQIMNLGFQITDPYDTDQNITGGIIYFKWLYAMYKSDPEQLEKTLAAWNWGQNNFSKKEPLNYELMPDETKNFIRDILSE